jgi:hypothetical protein
MKTQYLVGNLVTVFVLVFWLLHGPVYGQSPGTNSASFIDLSLKALMSTKAEERRGVRARLAHEITLLTDEQRLDAVGALIERLRTKDSTITVEIAAVLGALGQPWATRSHEADVALLYRLYLDATEDTLKSALDSAVANARGLYRDAIQDYNSERLPDDWAASVNKFTDMADRFTDSRYAENANFYLGLFYTKLYFLGHPRGKALIRDSDVTLENYIKRTERRDFVKADFLAAGYFYRALNGMIVNDVANSREWLEKGAQKFSDFDGVYIYRLFYSHDPETRVDKLFSAKSLFVSTLSFLSRNPNASPSREKELLAAIRR